MMNYNIIVKQPKIRGPLPVSITCPKSSSPCRFGVERSAYEHHSWRSVLCVTFDACRQGLWGPGKFQSKDGFYS